MRFRGKGTAEATTTAVEGHAAVVNQPATNNDQKTRRKRERENERVGGISHPQAATAVHRFDLAITTKRFTAQRGTVGRCAID